MGLATGVAAALLLVGATLAVDGAIQTTIVLVPAGTTESVPAFHNATLGGSSLCGIHRCGSPGMLLWNFSTTFPSRLTGEVHLGAPLEVWVGDVQGMEAACGLSYPPPPCAPPPQGPAYLYSTPAPVVDVNFGSLVLDFGGYGPFLPPGTWWILVINPGSAPVDVTATTAVVVAVSG